MTTGASEPFDPVELLRQAVEDPGPNPQWHYETMRRHRAEWPRLWDAIDALLVIR